MESIVGDDGNTRVCNAELYASTALRVNVDRMELEQGIRPVVAGMFDRYARSGSEGRPDWLWRGCRLMSVY